MPWKETSSVNERLRFIGLVNDSEDSFAALCEQFGISRKTGYKWAERYERLGPRGLEEARPVARSESVGSSPAIAPMVPMPATTAPRAP